MDDAEKLFRAPANEAHDRLSLVWRGWAEGREEAP
jgi:hypothetical protein